MTHKHFCARKTNRQMECCRPIGSLRRTWRRGYCGTKPGRSDNPSISNLIAPPRAHTEYQVGAWRCDYPAKLLESIRNTSTRRHNIIEWVSHHPASRGATRVQPAENLNIWYMWLIIGCSVSTSNIESLGMHIATI